MNKEEIDMIKGLCDLTIKTVNESPHINKFTKDIVIIVITKFTEEIIYRGESE